MKEIRKVLDERAKTYGAYADNAKLSQELKMAVRNQYGFRHLPYQHREAIDNILQKVARIVNGPGAGKYYAMYEDNWVDIIGYSQLVLDFIGEKDKKDE